MICSVVSAPGEMDIQMLTLLQSSLGDVQISTDIVEGSVELFNDFKGKILPHGFSGCKKKTLTECNN